MKALQLKHRCLIERKSVTQDASFGTEVITWTTVDTVWCDVQDVLPSRSFESNRNGLAVAANLTRVRMRYRTDLDASMRFTLYRPDAIINQVVNGPAELGDKEGIEFVVERFST